jgi:hypothetical protein
VLNKHLLLFLLTLPSFICLQSVSVKLTLYFATTLFFWRDWGLKPPHWPQTYNSSFASPVLELQVCATMYTTTLFSNHLWFCSLFSKLFNELQAYRTVLSTWSFVTLFNNKLLSLPDTVLCSACLPMLPVVPLCGMSPWACPYRVWGATFSTKLSFLSPAKWILLLDSENNGHFLLPWKTAA